MTSPANQDTTFRVKELVATAQNAAWNGYEEQDRAAAVVTSELVAMINPRAERIEPGAEAAHRDDLARDVARLWAAWALECHYYDSPPSGELITAAERLADAYGAWGRP